MEAPDDHNISYIQDDWRWSYSTMMILQDVYQGCRSDCKHRCPRFPGSPTRPRATLARFKHERNYKSLVKSWAKLSGKYLDGISFGQTWVWKPIKYLAAAPRPWHRLISIIIIIHHNYHVLSYDYHPRPWHRMMNIIIIIYDANNCIMKLKSVQRQKLRHDHNNDHFSFIIQLLALPISSTNTTTSMTTMMTTFHCRFLSWDCLDLVLLSRWCGNCPVGGEVQGAAW